ncbi:photosystem I chlorophyll a/b-binding protein 5, chloroplastic, partial [Tanacetum coccineum]
FVETKRYMDFTNPGSQAKQGSFFSLDAALEGLEPSPLLNHLGLANDIENEHVWKLKEIKNGTTHDVIYQMGTISRHEMELRMKKRPLPNRWYEERVYENHVMAMDAQAQILQLTNKNSRTSFYNRILIVLLVGTVLFRYL